MCNNNAQGESFQSWPNVKALLLIYYRVIRPRALRTSPFIELSSEYFCSIYWKNYNGIGGDLGRKGIFCLIP